MKSEGVLRNVSRETMARFELYENFLKLWQHNLNLVSPKSLPEVWERHFMDSYQLLSFLPEKPLTLIDLGSGAGFPGLVLAMARPSTLFVTLVESDFKKCIFLENVSRETFSKPLNDKTHILSHNDNPETKAIPDATSPPLSILCTRIENLDPSLKGDVITARGLAPLSQLLSYAYPLMKETSIGLFLKGKETEAEIEQARKVWKFNLQVFSSRTNDQGKILKIEHVRPIN